MRYYSDVLKKFFDKEDELIKAEEQHEKLQKELEEKKAKGKQEIVADKKLMAKAVEDADKEIDEAQEQYTKAIQEAKDVIQKAKEEADKIVSPAKEKLNEARQKRYDAIKSFNSKYGPYSVTYTGDKAYTEFKRNYDFINQFFNEFFRW